mmetsp:Transcript_13728/g.20411  ORF Transcript_13728/g.20411 Transcript_13728/m.20411 type:complete len:228 (-) Transcript_13728:515-1198(-)
MDPTHLIDFNMPLPCLFKFFQKFFVVHSFLTGHALQHGQNSGHHTLKSAEVNVGPVFELLEDFIGVLFHLVLDIHFASLRVRLLPGKGVVHPELVRVGFQHSLPFVIVQQRIFVCHAEEEPRVSLVVSGSGRLFNKQTAHEASVGSNTSAGCNHDHIGIKVLSFRQQHNLSSRASQRDTVPRLCIAQEIGTYSFFGGIFLAHFGIPISGPSHAQTRGCSGHVVPVAS